MKLYSVVASLLLLFANGCAAGLPVTVDGQALPSLAPMLEKATPAVVNISTRGKVVVRNSLLNDPLFKRFFKLPDILRERETMSLGSGVIVDASNGYILTNNHVVEDALEISVTLRDGRQLSAEILGRDPDTDIAVIKINAPRLHSMPFANSNVLRVGDFVVAIGNPFGLGQTVTSGIISALGRSGLGIESYEDFIQTDASINPGNSGGALVNLRGELVGINTAILGGSGSAGNIGIGFAIPINMAQDIMSQLIEYGEVKRGRLGVQAQDLTAELAKAFNIESTQGAVVTQVEQGSPAQKGGLKVGDVIIKANGRAVRSAIDVHNRIGMMLVGQAVELEVIRGGNNILIQTTIQLMEIVTIDGAEFSYRLAGASIGEIKESDMQKGLRQYLRVMEVEPNSQAWLTGVRKDDVIFSINKQRVETFEAAYAAARSSRNLLLNIHRGNQSMFLLIK
ncbi:MAG: DegQ family serine endoprotease [Gammaproteobacteria bacterium]|nr:DegQ family serine endoprotease [Gammaproteobacteria bacterium]MBL7001126.1 DegQ family serine endoprotease [Gammaproteobacteria bacterium]